MARWGGRDQGGDWDPPRSIRFLRWIFIAKEAGDVERQRPPAVATQADERRGEKHYIRPHLRLATEWGTKGTL